MSASALVLAAGEGTRMKSSLPKVAHEILGIPLVRYVVDAAYAGGCDRVVVVTGHGADVVEALVPDEVCVRQEQQLGTGHAVMCAEPALGVPDGSLVVLSGDSPLMRPETIAGLIDVRESTGAAVVVLTTELDDPAGYGRIVRDERGALAHIVEDKDLAPGQRAIREVNTGTYCFDAAVLFAHVHRLDNSNSQGEFYLTDMVRVLRDEGLLVADVMSDDSSETLGVNTRVQLAEAAAIMQRRINRAHLLAGVTMTSPGLVWIAPTVRLGRDIVLEPMTFLLGDTEVSDGCSIGPGARVIDSCIAAGAIVDSSVVSGTVVATGAKVGPFQTLGPESARERHVAAGAGTIPCSEHGSQDAADEDDEA